MKQEQIKDFTRRISQSNRSGLVVVIYDIIFAYLDDAKKSLAGGDYDEFCVALKKAQRGVDELMGTLNFQYEIAKHLYSLYVFVKEAMAKAVVKKSLEELEGAREVLMNLHAAFTEAAKQDHTNPLMKNTQQVYAGITYGKNDLTETFHIPETSRGFFA